jgi:superfamily II DNA or RNA helicase
LGKTLEIGMILSELARRGRGERILVVTPRHILEQFQHEMWTRFAIPLVRLDSEGIQRVRQRIPSNRNPFSFYKRVIISVDTLKDPGRYRHHLEGIHWDAVVFDECHNLVNKGTLNHELADVVAARTRALVLTSATPHNGDPKSFAHLIQLLDPTALVDPEHYEAADIQHLFIRRHKADAEVSAEVGSMWAERLPPKPIMVEASAAENAVFDELACTWLAPEDGVAPVSGKGARLFPFVLLKAALSSHLALSETVRNRRRTLADTVGPEGALSPERLTEDQALERLGELAGRVTDDGSSKLAALRDVLAEIGVGAGSDTRAVVFSERVETLKWLATAIPKLTGLGDDQVLIMYGGKSDVEQQEIVEEFGLEGTRARVLVTGDIASEGVNLHRQCHHLIHFDLPWSLIRLEQRNGRIDRYGQLYPPETRALLLAPDNTEVRGDVKVLTKLLDKEHHAHRALGDSASIMGLHDIKAEEDAVYLALRSATSDAAKADAIDAVVPDMPAVDSFDFLTFLAGQAEHETVPTVALPTLFVDDAAFIEEALAEVYEDPVRELEIRREAEHSLLSLVPPPDLAKRLEVLPQTYLKEQKILERLKLTTDRDVANDALARARASDSSIWPEVGFLSGQHPILDWLVDKVLVQFGRNEAPIIQCAVTEPTYLLQGVYSNAAGEPTVSEWLAVEHVGDGRLPEVSPMFEVLDRVGVGYGMINPSAGLDDDGLTALQAAVPHAVQVGREFLEGRRDDLVADLAARVAAAEDHLAAWSGGTQLVLQGMENEVRRTAAERRRLAVQQGAQEHIASLKTVGQPLVRVIAVLVKGT